MRNEAYRWVVRGIVLGLFGFVIVGCSFLGLNEKEDDDDPVIVENPQASQNIKDLPEIEAQLPASLSAGGTTGSSASIVGTAVDDVTVVEASGIPDVKAQGWYDMKDAAGLDFMTEAFIDELKEIADEQDLAFGVVYDLGDRAFFDGTYDMGQMKLTGTENDMTVYWFAKPMTGMSFWARIGIARDGDDWVIEATFYDDSPDWLNKTYAEFNTATGESLFLSDASGTDADYGDFSYQDITRSIPNDDGSLTIISGFSEGSGSWGETRIGWGNDSMGGVIGIGQWGDGETFASKEYYNGSGSLVQQSWGMSEIYGYGLSWVESGGWGVNLASYGFTNAPATVYLFNVWDSDTSSETQYISDDEIFGDADDQELTTTGYSPYFKAAGTSGSWASGDAVYNWMSGAEYDDGDTTTWVWREEYDLGYQIPAGESVFGGTFYFEDRYPLKHLLPLAGSYAGNTLRREEGETYTDSWTDDMGNEETWSWTDYTYFIDLDNDGAYDSFGENADVFLDGVWMSENWVWDSANEQEIKVKAPFLTTTAGRFPGYLSFSSSNETLVSTVETKILDVYNNQLSSLSFGDYQDKLIKLGDLPEFDDVEF